MTTIISKIRKTDGMLVRIHPDSREAVMEKRAIGPMTEEEVMAAALSDPDARPVRPDDAKRMPRTPQVRVIRRALGLSQEQFAAQFHIPLGTLRDWEQGRKDPDAARAPI